MKSGILLLTLLMPFCGFATVYNITSTADGNALNQLRGAITDADNNGGTSTINVPAGVYVLTMGSIALGDNAENITIVGAGAASTIIEVSPTAPDRILTINPFGGVAAVTVVIQGITFRNGYTTFDDFGGGAILGGGPENVLTIQNCVFSNNSTPKDSSCSGGALAMEGGGTLTISGSVFNNNVDPNGDGGAVFYVLQNGLTGSMTVTNTTFNGNSCTTSGSEGGAMLISISGASSPDSTSAISITQCTFTNNTVSGTNSLGGAISIDNAYAVGNTAHINYNRFYGNHAAAIPDVVVGNSQGNVDVTNNWWGRNGQPAGSTDPHALLQTGTGVGTMPYSPWLELHVAGGSPGVCYGTGGVATATANFLTNSSGGAVSASNLGAVKGLPVTFSGTLASIASSLGSIQTNGADTAYIDASASSGTAVVEAIVDSVPVTDAVSRASFSISDASSLPTASASSVFTVGTGLPVTDANCHEICLITPSGASPISGSVTAGVTLDGSVQSVDGQPYVTRHYDITPATGASTATATIKLYFLQSEFNAYNAVVTNSALWLPTGASDVTGRGNLTITQFHGSGTAPGNYSGWTGPGPASVLISPGSSNVIWNSTMSWWEVSFPVTGFSGFYVTGPLSTPLPVVLINFTGVRQGSGVLLNWQVGVETGLSRYEVESSVDGVVFSHSGIVLADGSATYQYFVTAPSPGLNFYRLKMVNTDGSFGYSSVAVVDLSSAGAAGVQVLSNPFTSTCVIRVTAASAGPVRLRLTDISGKVLWRSDVVLTAGVNTFTLPSASTLAKGIYLLTVSGGQMQETVKVVKE